MQIQELINKVCTLSCTKEDLVLDYSSIKNIKLKENSSEFICENKNEKINILVETNDSKATSQ